jgi:low molecular weight protein-tyrosine phosphatase
LHNHTETTGVLFICLGNICRSPLAEGIFTHLVEQRDLSNRFKIDSCGTGAWHVGNPPDPRSILVADKHGIDLTHLRARKYDAKNDPTDFDWHIVMDGSNHRDILDLGTPQEQVRLMRSFDSTLSSPTDVPDPYYGGDDGFDKVFVMLMRACEGLIAHLSH